MAGPSFGHQLRLVLFLVWRGWRGHPLRTALTVLGVALGIGVVIAIHVMDHNTIQSRMRRDRPEAANIDLELTPRQRRRDPQELLSLVREQPGIAEVEAIHSASVLVGAGSGGAPERVLGAAVLYGLDSTDDPFGRVLLVEQVEDRGRETGVLIGSAFAAEHDLKLGETIFLAVPPRVARAPCVNGVREAPTPIADGDPLQVPVTVEGILGEFGLGERDDGRLIVGSLKLARYLAATNPTLLQVGLEYGADTDAISSNLSREFRVDDGQSALLGESADERAFRNGVKLLGGLALMLGMFVVFQTLSHALVERLRQIGLWRCLGTSSNTVAAVFLTDALLTAVVGAVLGVGLGVLLAFGLREVGLSSLGVTGSWDLDEIPLSSVLWTSGLGIVFTLAGAAFPWWQARRLSAVEVLHARGLGRVKDVLKHVHLFLFGLLVLVVPVGYLATTTLLSDSDRETLIVIGQLAVFLLLFGVLLLVVPGLVPAIGRLVTALLKPIASFPSHLAASVLKSQRGRVSASTCGLGLVLLAVVGLESLTSSLHGDARRLYDESMVGTLYLEGREVDIAKMREEIAPLKGVARIDTFRGPVKGPFELTALDTEEMSAPGRLFAERPGLATAFENERTVVISRRLAALKKLEPGFELFVSTDGGEVAYEVLAVSDAGGYFPDDPAFAVCHPKWLKRDFCIAEDKTRRLAVRMDGTRTASELRKDIWPFFKFNRVKSGAELRAYMLRDVTRDFRLFQVLLGLILALAGLGVVNAMTIATLGRVRELGVLRALGTSRRQVFLALVIEGGVTGLLSSLTALALGVPLGRGLVTGMNEVAGTAAPYVFPAHAFLWVPLLGIGIGTLAAVVPGLRASRIDPARAVRFE